MAGNDQLPRDVTKLFEVKMTDEPMRMFLRDLVLRLNRAETKIVELEARIVNLEN